MWSRAEQSVASSARSSSGQRAQPAHYTSPPSPPLQAAVLIEALSHNAVMTAIDFSWCGLEERAACALGDLLRTNRALRHVKLDHNRIGPEGAIVIASGLGANRTLETIELSWNPLGKRGLATLLARGERSLHVLTAFVCCRFTQGVPFELCVLRDATLLVARCLLPATHEPLVPGGGHCLLALRTAALLQAPRLAAA